jgi:hypothetical protein
MTDIEKRVALAEFAGWRFQFEIPGGTWTREVDRETKLVATSCWVRPGSPPWETERLPRYTDDLNRVQDLISLLRDKDILLYREYALYLGVILTRFNVSPERESYHPIETCDATASMRCDAIGHVLNLW